MIGWAVVVLLAFPTLNPQNTVVQAGPVFVDKQMCEMAKSQVTANLSKSYAPAHFTAVCTQVIVGVQGTTK